MSDWSLVSGLLCFSWTCSLKETRFDRKNEVNFLRLFENPLSNYLIFQTISCVQWLFWVIYQNYEGESPWLLVYNFNKNVLYLILHQLTKVQFHIFFPSRDIKQNVLLSSYFDNCCCHELEDLSWIIL